MMKCSRAVKTFQRLPCICRHVMKHDGLLTSACALEEERELGEGRGGGRGEQLCALGGAGRPWGRGPASFTREADPLCFNKSK